MISKELKKRIITSIILIAIVINCLFINNYLWLSLLTVVSFICWLEFINLIKKIWKKRIKIIFPTILSFLFLFLFINAGYKIRLQYGAEEILFILAICVFSDVGGYIVGKNIGGKKLTKISPNKTVSGSIGSFLFSLFPIVIFIFFSIEVITQDRIIIFCLLLSLSCQLGDLAISYFKRLAKIKDTGSILPGHGGMLDRVDGIIFAIPSSLIIINYVL